MKRIAPLFLLFFAPLLQAQDLMTIYQLAQQNDPQLKAVREQLAATRETKTQAWARLLPTIGLSASYDAIRQDIQSSPFGGNEGISHFNNRDLGLNLSMPVYRRDFLVQLDQADNTIAEAEAKLAAAQIDLMLRSTTAYFNILSAKDDLRVAKAEQEANKRQLEQAKQRFDVGLIAITDVHEAQASYDAARAAEIGAENSLDNAWEALLEIIGPQPQGGLASLGKGLRLQTPEPNDLQSWSDTAQQQNFDIIAARNQLESARQEIEVNRSGHYPTLDLVGGYQLNRSTNEFSSESDTTSIGLQLDLPIYTGGGVTSRTQQARATYRATQQSLDQTRRSVNRQVRDAFRGVLSTISRVKALQAATVSAKSALESTEAGYEVGTRTIVDVLDVQRNLFSSQRDYLRSRYDYIINGFKLKAATGNLAVEDLQRVNGWLEH